MIKIFYKKDYLKLLEAKKFLETYFDNYKEEKENQIKLVTDKNFELFKENSKLKNEILNIGTSKESITVLKNNHKLEIDAFKDEIKKLTKELKEIKKDLLKAALTPKETKHKKTTKKSVKNGEK